MIVNYVFISQYYNEFENKGIKHLAKGVQSLKKLRKLDINLRKNNIFTYGFKHLCNSIEKLSSLTCLILDLNNNSIDKLGVFYLLR